MPRTLKYSLIVILLVLIAAPVAAYLLIPNLQITNFKVLLNAMFGASQTAPAAEEVKSRLITPAGFRLNIYANDVANARVMRLTSAGDLIVSQPRKGQLTLVRADQDNDGRSDGQQVLLTDLTRPHGIDIHDGWLYVAESDAIGKIKFDAANGTTSGAYQRIVKGWSDKGNHWSKTLRVGPDEWLYVTSGSTCNVCEEQDPHRAVMLRISLDGQQTEIYATGLRNAVGFDWAPWSEALYVTENGRDLLGDDIPPDELNQVKRGEFYGWPYAYGNNVPDADFIEGRELQAKAAIPPVFEFRAHNAPLGITFLQHVPRTALVALHGSWNRSIPDGYKVVALQWDADENIRSTDFVRGFEKDGDVIGRPVDVVENERGDVFISDDYAGVIYRVSRTKRGARKMSKTVAAPSVWEPEMLDPAFVGVGKSIYRKTGCVGCHGARPGDTEGVAKPLVDLQRHRLADLIEILTTPQPPMPQYDLGRNARTALAQYMLAEAGAAKTAADSK